MQIVKLRVTTENAHEEVYRWDPGKPLINLTYANVIKSLRTLTNRGYESFILRYNDGFDMCRIMNTKDLRCAINYLQQKPSRDDCLQLYAEPQTEKRNPCSQTQIGVFPTFFKPIEPKVEQSSRNSATESGKPSKVGPIRRSRRKRSKAV
ncbi:hypothetical protein D915_000554 [Fasciola hepatica]|uniref:Uncharacterized protein n=1 Tax=Fasciola hepatica TaxID=6192 RepID=A0A4E0RK28_FASHE|nr:hypothetical protein D915_000554 [Fasciola hepatica]